MTPQSPDPVRAAGPEREPLYGPEFAADPAAVYARLRRHGPVAPVELAPGVPATLVTSYDTALDVLRDPSTFPRDARRWQTRLPPDSPLLPVMMYRPACNSADGDVHARLRGAVADSLDRVDSGNLRGLVERVADRLIDGFATAGRADILGQYARDLPVLVFNELAGCSSDIGSRLATSTRTSLDAANSDGTARAIIESNDAIMELLALKHERPAADLASWLIHHPARLTPEEAAHQLVVIIGAGTDPVCNLISNGLRLLLSDDRFAGDLSGGSLPVEDALDEILWTDPPLANLATSYPRRDVDLAGVRLPADEPVLVSFAAANTDPNKPPDHRTGNRAHLAWSAGPHTCPGRSQARLIASAAIERLLDRLPDMRLAVPTNTLKWRPGPFHRALVELPVVFPPMPLPEPEAVREPDTAPRIDTPSGPPPSGATTTYGARAGSPSSGRSTHRGTNPGLWRTAVRWWRGLGRRDHPEP